MLNNDIRSDICMKWVKAIIKRRLVKDLPHQLRSAMVEALGSLSREPTTRGIYAAKLENDLANSALS